MKLNKSILFTFISISIFAFATISAWLYSRIDSALPMLDGKETVFGLTATTVVERDASGIPTITADNRNDIAVAIGFVHAQERFFQMDLLRRNSAGELSSLFGDVALEYDKKIRVHRFRERAREIVKHLPEAQALLLKAYTRGVNQGLDNLRASPFEYLLLQQDPVPWHEEDTILTVFSMYLDLQYDRGERELTLDIMNKVFASDVYAFLNPKGSQWDAAIDGTTYAPSPMPADAWPAASHAFNNTKDLAEKTGIPEQENFVGSNNWAVSGALTQSQSALVANDMHLGIRVPNIWFRARFKYKHQEQAIDVTGASLPGTPAIIVGSNTKIAWGFTNSYGDWSDVIVLETHQDNNKYLTPDGLKDFTVHKQVIAIKDKQSIEIETKETIWGPVIGVNEHGKLLVYRWVAHDRRAVNMDILDLEQAKTVQDALKIASKAGVPAQNMMVGDHLGNIAWTIFGPIPKKVGNVGDLPQDWSTGKYNWDGYLSYIEYPKVINPEQHRLWTANSRVVGDENLALIGNGGYALGARSQQIRDRLFEQESFDENAFLTIALDTEARFMKRWQDLLITDVLSQQAIDKNPRWRNVKQQLDVPSLNAEIDSVAYRIVRNFRLNVRNITFEDFNKHLEAYNKDYDFNTIKHQLEVPLWQLVSSQSDNFMWLPRASWSLVFEEALNKTIADMEKNQSLDKATWGQENSAKIIHPLASSIPFFGQYLNMPTEPIAGDGYMPRVDGGSFGASERMIVSPGREETGIFHMPTSQAGHPWSPYFGKGHQDWVEGTPSPFLPQETVYKLTLLSY